MWNHTFEFDEIGDGEYLKLKCFNEDTFGDENIGSATVNLEGLLERSVRDVWIPLERVSSGELRLLIEAVRVEDQEGSRVCFVTSENKHFFHFSFTTLSKRRKGTSCYDILLYVYCHFSCGIFIVMCLFVSLRYPGFSFRLQQWLD